MCYRRSRYREEESEQVRGRRLWDLFYRETEHSEPVPIVEHEEEPTVAERERDEAPVGADR